MTRRSGSNKSRISPAKVGVTQENLVTAPVFTLGGDFGMAEFEALLPSVKSNDVDVVIVPKSKKAEVKLTKYACFRPVIQVRHGRQEPHGRGAAADVVLKDYVYRPLREGAFEIVHGELVYEPETPPIAHDAYRPGARARALLRGVKQVENDLKDSGGAFSLEEVQTLLHGVSRQRVDKRVKEKTLLAVPGPSNRRVYPAVQFRSDGQVVDGLKDVQAALPTENPWMVLNFLIHPSDQLGGKAPMELLKKGDVEPVIDAARSVGQQGA